MTRSTSDIVRAAFLLALALAPCVLTSCTSSGDGGVTGTTDYLNRGVRVEPNSTTALTYVGLEETAGDATTTCIGIEAHRMTGVFSAAFSVSYDPGLLRYTGYDASASCLGIPPTVLAPQVDAVGTPGRIVVGLTRSIASTNVGSDSCGHLIDLCFDVVGNGEFNMAFVGNLAILQPDGTPVADLGANWVDARVIVTP